MGSLDLDTELLQRRWSAALLASKRLEAKCCHLLETLRRADEAWRRACGELAALEALTEAFENQLTGDDEATLPRAEAPRWAVMSAA